MQRAGEASGLWQRGRGQPNEESTPGHGGWVAGRPPASRELVALYADDDAGSRDRFGRTFRGECSVVTASSAAEALAVLVRQPVGVVLTGERAAASSGLELLARVAERWPHVVRVIVSADSDAPAMLRAITDGKAHEYAHKPWDEPELRACLVRSLAVARRRYELMARAGYGGGSNGTPHARLNKLFCGENTGKSASSPMRQRRRFVARSFIAGRRYNLTQRQVQAFPEIEHATRARLDAAGASKDTAQRTSAWPVQRPGHPKHSEVPMMFRTALTSGFLAALALFVLPDCENSGGGGGGGYAPTTDGGAGTGAGKDGGGGGGAGGGTGGGDHGVNTGIPCRQILDCRALCDEGDKACFAGCYDAAYPHGQELEAALEKCYVDNDCEDWNCAEANCEREVKQCDADVPPGGYICFAEGIYQVCDHRGLCAQYPGYGGGWGATEQYAAFWGVYDCNDFMTSMVIINSTTGFASVLSDCSITKCGPN